jgi:hypothetical protein
VHKESLGYDLADGEARRQRAERILEDELQFAPEPALLLQVERLEIAAFEPDRPFARQKPEQSSPERGFAEPDSPTMPIVWPLCRVSETRSTAFSSALPPESRPPGR